MVRLGQATTETRPLSHGERVGGGGGTPYRSAVTPHPALRADLSQWERCKDREYEPMAITLSGDDAIPSPPFSARLTAPQIWGIVMLAPYMLVFAAFVVYPVCYGLWLARHPASYVALYHDPVFARAAVNTLIFLVIGINIKMVIALFLSGFFIQERRWIKWLSVLFILPWAVPSIPTILSVRFMFNPEWGMVNQVIFKFTAEDGPNC